FLYALTSSTLVSALGLKFATMDPSQLRGREFSSAPACAGNSAATFARTANDVSNRPFLIISLPVWVLSSFGRSGRLGSISSRTEMYLSLNWHSDGRLTSINGNDCTGHVGRCTRSEKQHGLCYL